MLNDAYVLTRESMQTRQLDGKVKDVGDKKSGKSEVENANCKEIR